MKPFKSIAVFVYPKPLANWSAMKGYEVYDYLSDHFPDHQFFVTNTPNQLFQALEKFEFDHLVIPDLTILLESKIIRKFRGKVHIHSMIAGMDILAQLVLEIDQWINDGLNTLEKQHVSLIKEISVINKEWIEIIKHDPAYMLEMKPREFEEFIAELWFKRGYEIELTSSTRDGGKDIYAFKKNIEGDFLYAIECKRYATNNKVGRPILQQLYGVVESEKLTGGIIAATSYFSKDATSYAEPLRHRLHLHDIEVIKRMIETG